MMRAMLLGGAISLLVGFLVLAAAALVILVAWLLLGRREDRPLRNPFTAYLGIVLFISLITALGSARVVVSSIGSALADYPLGTSCPPEVEFEGVPAPARPVPDLGELTERVQGSDSAVGELYVPGQVQAPPQPAQPAPRLRGPFSPPTGCEVISARDRAAVQAAEGGTALIISLGILLFHARAGRRLLDEENRDA
jgi:hypothetical protein